MLPLVPGNQPAGRGDDPPPRHAVRAAPPQQVPHGPGGTGVAGLLGDLAVGHHIARSESTEHGEHVVLEGHGAIVPDRG